MDGNNGKKLRNLLLYIGIPVVVLFIIIFLFSNRSPQGATYKYSDILDFFETGRVTEYSLNLGTGEMVLKLDDSNIHKHHQNLPLFYTVDIPTKS